MFSVVVSILISLNIYPHLQCILSAENITFGDKDLKKEQCSQTSHTKVSVPRAHYGKTDRDQELAECHQRST